MKIVLVSANVATTPYPVFPLGASVVANALREAGHTVEFIDWLAEGCSAETLRTRVRDASPDLLAVAIRNIDNVNSVHEERYLDRAAEVAAILRSVSPAPMLLGGAGFSLMPEAILQKLGADYGIVGEGEQAVVDFVRSLATNPPPRGTILRSPALLAPAGMGRSDYTIACAEYYIRNGGMIGVQTKRGCLYECAYCTYPFLEGHTLRPRPPAAVVDDIARLVDKGMSYHFFVDAVFNDAQGLYMDVVREMQARKLSVRWAAYLSPRAIPDDHLAAMVETGFASAEVGSDAATDATLRGMNKPHTWADIASFNAALRKHDIPTAHYFIFGGPGETPETVKAGIDNIRSLEGTVRFIISGIRVLPGTRIAALHGDIAGQLLEPEYYFSPAVPRDTLEAMLREAFDDDPLCMYPLEKMAACATAMHQRGFCGPMWEMMLGRRPPRRLRPDG